MRRSIACFLFFILAYATFCEAQKREYVLVIHGDAGAMSGLEANAEQSARYYADHEGVSKSNISTQITQIRQMTTHRLC